MPSFGIPELLIILVIVVLLFGVGRISKISGEIGNGINACRKGIKDGEDDDSEKDVKKE